MKQTATMGKDAVLEVGPTAYNMQHSININ